MNASFYPHRGYAEARHDRCDNVHWYKEQKCCTMYVKNLQNGDYTPCGSSGGQTWNEVGSHRPRHHTSKIDTIVHHRLPSNIYSCCFVSGTNCQERILWRRMSCCPTKVIEGPLKALACFPCSQVQGFDDSHH
jgi:hypothetical protein